MRIANVSVVCIIIAFSQPITVFSQDTQDPQQHLKIQHSAKMHGVHSQKLGNIMQRLIAMLMSPPSKQADQEQQAKYNKKLVKLSKKVTMTAASINKYLANDKLNEKQTAKFMDLATQLHDEALNAQTEAVANDPEALNMALGRFNQTCVSCHRLFREK